MMCFKYRKLIIPYSEGALDERTRTRMEAHLASCESCRLELEAVQSVSSVLRSLDEPAVEPAPDLWAKVSARIADEVTVSAPVPWLKVLRTASTLTAVALVAVVAVGVFNRAPEIAPTPDTKRVAVAPELRKPMLPEVEDRDSRPAVIYVDGHVKRAPVVERKPEMALQSTPKAPAHRSNRPVMDKMIGSRYKADSSPEPNRTDKAKDGYVVMAREDHPNDYDAYKPAPTDTIGSLSETDISIKSAVDEEAKTLAAAFYHDSARSESGNRTLSDSSIGRDDLARPAPSAMANAAPGGLALSFEAYNVKPMTADMSYHCMTDAPTDGVRKEEETAVDVLNRTEGVHIVAMFRYP